jgi:Universal stress protein family
VVMGSHGRGAVGRLLRGSTAQAVLRHAECSVEIVRVVAEGGSSGGMRVLVPTDGSTHAEATLRTIAELPWPPRSEFKVLTSPEYPVLVGEYPYYAPEQLAELTKQSLEHAKSAVETGAELLKQGGLAGDRRSDAAEGHARAIDPGSRGSMEGRPDRDGLAWTPRLRPAGAWKRVRNGSATCQVLGGSGAVACGDESESSGGMSHAAGVGHRSKRTIHNLIDGIDRFPLTGPATKNENARNELEMGLVHGSPVMVLAVFSKNDFGNPDGLAAVAAMNSAKLLRRQFERHEDCSLDP